MLAYWEDSAGVSPPTDTDFQIYPFFPNERSPFLSPAIQIDSLPSQKVIPVRSMSFFPDRTGWDKMVNEALFRIRRGDLEKVVLARMAVFECIDVPDPFQIVSALKKRKKNASLFCFSEGDIAFLGASPEKLFSRRKREITSVAMAGTRKRGQTPKEDLELEKELLNSQKDFREWSPIQRHLETSLSPFLSSPLKTSPLSVYKTENVQHLYSQCKGRLKKGIGDLDILQKIHPTPALSGTPNEPAYSLIRELEPFDRGLYGGVVGWSTPVSSEYIVAIRSSWIEGKTVKLFTGTGIVEGSDPSLEWDELNQKMKLYDGIFV